MEILGAIVLFNAFLALIVAYMVIKMNTKLWVKFLLIPFIIFVTNFSINSFDVNGYPYHHIPDGDFELVKHQSTLNSKGILCLQIWGIENGQSRLFEIPYNPLLDQAMGEAEEEKGHKMIFNLHAKGKGIKGNGRFDQYGGAGFSVKDATPSMPSKEEPR